MPRKRCYYEVLELPSDASDEDITRNYRRLALKYHPDKNLDNSEEATALFREVKEAFDCLNDKSERAWYDKHKDEILYGADKEDIDDELLDVFPYFSSSCYSKFDDSETGFYTIYRDLFERIAKDDLMHADDDYVPPPSFGSSDSPYSQVQEFYNHWQSYCTLNPFYAASEFDLRDATNSRERKFVERHNKKVRDTEKKKRNEQIRENQFQICEIQECVQEFIELVAFVKRRDRRVRAHKLEVEKKMNEKRQKQEQARLKQISEENEKLKNYQETDWSSMSALQNELKEIEKSVDEELNSGRRGKKNRKKNRPKQEPIDFVEEETINGDIGDESAVNIDENGIDQQFEEELEDNGLCCIACDKVFKTVKAFENHERSKKHKVNITKLKELLNEDEQLIEES